MTRELPDLLGECLELLEAGGQGAVEELLREHPEHESTLRKRLQLLAGIGFAAPNQQIPDRLGPFLLGRRIGGGGMGVVYLAVQEPLGREVALKLVRPDLLFFEEARLRFYREIEIISQLQHPGIVPVYLSGTEAGIPYYAMEFLQGGSLAEALQLLTGRRLAALRGADLWRAVCHAAAHPAAMAAMPELFEGHWVETCFRVVLRAAEALQHAHGQQVLHRDLKPSNLMFDLHGRVMLVDFGLAASRRSPRVTQSGSAVGSLAYMSPEQLAGHSDRIDARTDVYSLGVCLYEMLTLCSPHLAADPEETRRRIVAGTPTPPRRIHAAIPWDAETICLTAMDRDPGRRYATMADLAVDLRNFLEHRVIRARRPGPLLRLSRFIQRHPTGSTAAGLGVALLAGATGYAVQQAHSNRLLREAILQVSAHRTAAVEAAAQAEQNFARAFDFANQLVRIGFEELRSVPGFADVRGDLMHRSETFYAQLLEQRPADRDLRLEMARNQRLMAQQRAEEGALREAQEDYRRAVLLLEELLAEDSTDGASLFQLTACQNQLGITLQGLGLHAEARPHLERAVELSEILMQSRGSSRGSPGEVPYLQVSAKLNLAGALAVLHEEDAARAVIEASLPPARDLFALQRSIEEQMLLGGALLNLAVMELDEGLLEEALDHSLEANESFGQLLAAHPRDAAVRMALAASFGSIAASYQDLDEVSHALDSGDEARALLEELVRDFPGNHDLLLRLCRELRRIGELHLARAEPDLAREALAVAEQRIQPLLAAEPEPLPGALVQKLCLDRTLARLKRLEQQPAAAERALRSAWQIRGRIEERWPLLLQTGDDYLGVLDELLSLLESEGRTEEADELRRSRPPEDSS